MTNLGTGAYLTPEEPLGQYQAASSLLVNIQKTDNGFVVSLYDPPKPLTEGEIERDIQEEEDRLKKQMDEDIGGKSIDERIDAMVDGLIAFQKHIMDRSTGEDWKGDDVKEKIREGFKVMFPQLVGGHRGRRLNIMRGSRKPARLPRQETMVFQTVEQLMEYLKKNL